MKGKIAIEPALANVREFLAGEGYAVENMNLEEQTHRNLNAYDAIVATGMNMNMLGVEDTSTSAPVINADGLSPTDVAKRLHDIGL